MLLNLFSNLAEVLKHDLLEKFIVMLTNYHFIFFKFDSWDINSIIGDNE